MVKLTVFDLDGTIVHEPEFYRTVYSGTLTELVKERRGESGLEILRQCRENYNGKGELALLALNIPFREWAQRLIHAPLDLISPRPTLVEQIRKLSARKVIYTGSPTEMAERVLGRLGFAPQDFDDIVGWKESELLPVKWTCSSLVFETILKKFSVVPSQAWAVGDDWEADLLPAHSLGMKTARIRKQGGSPSAWFPTVEEFLAQIEGGENE